MCISDWRLGRQIRSVARNVSIAAGGTFVINSSPQRVGLIFYPNAEAGTGGLSFTMTMDGVFLGAFGGGTYPIVLSLESTGDMSTHQWTIGNTDTNVHTFAFVELFLPEGTLAAGLAEFLAKYGR